MREIPLLNVPNQQLQVVLGGQDCTIHVYQRGPRVYLDLDLDGEMLCEGAICMPGVAIGGELHPFVGTLIFADELASPDAQEPPQYEGFRTRWKFYYVEDGEEY